MTKLQIITHILTSWQLGHAVEDVVDRGSSGSSTNRPHKHAADCPPVHPISILGDPPQDAVIKNRKDRTERALSNILRLRSDQKFCRMFICIREYCILKLYRMCAKYAACSEATFFAAGRKRQVAFAAGRTRTPKYGSKPYFATYTCRSASRRHYHPQHFQSHSTTKLCHLKRRSQLVSVTYCKSYYVNKINHFPPSWLNFVDVRTSDPSVGSDASVQALLLLGANIQYVGLGG